MKNHKEETMNGFVPISVAAEQADYSYSMVQKLAKSGRIKTHDFYGRKLVNLASVLDYRRQMQALGPAKHVPHQYREDDTNTAEANPTPEAV